MSAARPRVTVIITVFDRWDYLRTAVLDALNQTYRDIEVVVADDCSQGDVHAVLAGLEDPRLSISRNARRLGAGGNFAAAAMAAKGEFVASLNDDDRWKPEFLETTLAALSSHPEAVLAFCDFDVIDEEGVIDGPASESRSLSEGRRRLRPGPQKPFADIALVDRCVFFANAVLVRRAAVDWQELADSNVQHHWDHYCNYLASRSGEAAVYVDQRLTQHRVHPKAQGQLAGHADLAAKFRLAESAMRCNDRFRRDPRLRERWPYFNSLWADAATTLGVAQLQSGDRVAARQSFRDSLRAERTLRASCSLALSYFPRPLAQRVALRAKRRWLPEKQRPMPSTTCSVDETR